MCLETPAFFAKRRVAKEDMTVWKFMIRRHIKTTELLFAYYRFGFRYRLGCVYTDQLAEPMKWNGFFRKSSISKGFHSLSYFQDAVSAHKRDNKENAVVVRCTIPKGSEYYVGNWEGYKGYASNSIRIDEIIPDALVSHTNRICSGGSQWAI